MLWRDKQFLVERRLIVRYRPFGLRFNIFSLLAKRIGAFWMRCSQLESASPLFRKGRQALVGDISPDETERVEGGGARRIVMIGVTLCAVGVVRDALDHQPRDQRMSAH